MDNKFDISSEPVNSWYMIKKPNFLSSVQNVRLVIKFELLDFKLYVMIMMYSKKVSRKAEKLIVILIARMQKEMFKKCVVES